jgi:hypothetical protein
MKKNHLILTIVFLLVLSAALSACAPGGLLGPSLTPTPMFTSDSVQEFSPTPTASVPASISAITMHCDDQASIDNGVYRAENNTWGKGTLSGWSQCIGLGNNPDGTLMGRWTWDWLSSGNNVKAYPEVIFGQKPGSTTTSPDLPRKITSVDKLTVTYDVTSTYTGSGNIAFDIWLTDTQNPYEWGVPPITHEIMIWLDRYGSMPPGGSWIERVELDGAVYSVYTAENWGDGWRYIAFVRADSGLGAGTLHVGSFTTYLQTRSLVSGEEYLASIEFGNEVATGAGETILYNYSIFFEK